MSSALKDIDKLLPTPKRVIRQNQRKTIPTNAPNAGDTAFKVMFNAKLSNWMQVKEVLFYYLSTTNHAVPTATLKALKVFVQLMVTPVSPALIFEVDEQRDLLVLEFVNRSEQGDPLANAVYLYISLQTRLRWISARKQKIEQVFLPVQFTYKLQRLRSLLVSFIMSFFETLDGRVDTCNANDILACLQFLQKASRDLDSLYVICDILADTQRVLQKKCRTFIEQERLLQCDFLQSMLGKVLERATVIDRNLGGKDKTLFQQFTLELQDMTSGYVAPKATTTSEETSETKEEQPLATTVKREPTGATREPIQSLTVVRQTTASRRAAEEYKNAEISNWYVRLGIKPPEDDPTFEKHFIELPARICIVGRSGQGKTNAVLNFIERTLPLWTRIVVFSGVTIEEPLYKNLNRLYPNVEMYTNINNPRLKLPRDNNQEDKKFPKLIIFDDFIALPKKDQVVFVDYATNSRNYGWTCIFIGQKFLGDTGIPVPIRANCDYFFFFKIRSRTDITNIKEEANAIENDNFEACYQHATQEPMNFFMIDKRNSETKYRTNFLGFCNKPEYKDTLVNFYERFGFSKPEKPASWRDHYIMLPARICVIGPSGEGKSNLMVELISRFGSMWDRIVIFTGGDKTQPLYRALEERVMTEEGTSALEIYTDVARLDPLVSVTNTTPKLIFFDDFLASIKKNKGVLQVLNKYAIASRKFGWTCVYLAQHFSSIPKVVRDQCSYFFLLPGLSKRRKTNFLQNVDVNKEVFDRCYDRVNLTKESLKKGRAKVRNPFVLIDVETHDDRFSVRLGFLHSCSDYRLLSE